MRGLRKEVIRDNPLYLETPLLQKGEISRKRPRTAGEIGDFPDSLLFSNPIDDRRLQARPRGVGEQSAAGPPLDPLPDLRDSLRRFSAEDRGTRGMILEIERGTSDRLLTQLDPERRHVPTQQ
jgi:hypothetical protein